MVVKDAACYAGLLDEITRGVHTTIQPSYDPLDIKITRHPHILISMSTPFQFLIQMNTSKTSISSYLLYLRENTRSVISMRGSGSLVYYPVTGYPLSLPSETLPLLPSPPACSFCDLRLLATSQRILPPFAETPLTSPFHSATSFALPNSRPHGLRTSTSCPRLRLRSIFAPTLYPTSLTP